MPDGSAATATAPGSITLSPVTTYEIDGLGETSLGADLNLTVGGLSMTVQSESGYVVIP